MVSAGLPVFRPNFVKENVRLVHNNSDAVQKLLLLELSKTIREDRAKKRRAGIALEYTIVEDTQQLLERTGLSLERLDDLSVIHVAGSKGKGTTCAMCESMLRHHGRRTGLFTGPHLFQIRERIRLDGRPLSEDKFAAYAQRLYTRMVQTQVDGRPLPNFFSFMTVMAFNVFLDEGVDVAVVEVGCGGIDDATNILRKVPVVGITSLELEHTYELGDTLAEIAAAKAGIMKSGCQAFTVPQPAEAMRMLEVRAQELRCPLVVAAPLADGSLLPVDVPACRTNGALALRLVHAWLRLPLSPALPAATVTGLASYRWPGRYHIIDTPSATFYMDFAHTKNSVALNMQWFADVCDNTTCKILLYSSSLLKDYEIQLKLLSKIEFKHVYFISPKVYMESMSETERLYYKDMHALFAAIWDKTSSTSRHTTLECLDNFLKDLEKLPEKPSVLVTGNPYIVGTLVSLFDPKCIYLS